MSESFENKWTPEPEMHVDDIVAQAEKGTEKYHNNSHEFWSNLGWKQFTEVVPGIIPLEDLTEAIEKHYQEWSAKKFDIGHTITLASSPYRVGESGHFWYAHEGDVSPPENEFRQKFVLEVGKNIWGKKIWKMVSEKREKNA